MSRLAFCWPGKTSAQYASVGIAEYLGRIGHYREVREVVSREERRGSQYTDEHRLEREGAHLLERIDGLSPAWVCALDPAGKALNTRGFARLLRRQLYEDTRTAVFVVGGPDGLSCSVRNRADQFIGLSRMTLPHDLARLVLVEQVYRALTIINGHPYDR